MRLNISNNSAEERLLVVLNAGYKLMDEIFSDYSNKKDNSTFDVNEDINRYNQSFQGWARDTEKVLLEIFPTQLERNFFKQT